MVPLSRCMFCSLCAIAVRLALLLLGSRSLVVAAYPLLLSWMPHPSVESVRSMKGGLFPADVFVVFGVSVWQAMPGVCAAELNYNMMIARIFVHPRTQ